MAKKTSLVLGCSGQDGSLLSLSLLKQNYEVIGTSRKRNTSERTEISNHSILGIDKDIKLENCFLDDFKTVMKLIEKYKPVEIYNLAAQTSVGKSYTDPKKTFTSVIDVTLNILEICKELKYDGNIFFAGSSEMFGDTKYKANMLLNICLISLILTQYGIDYYFL